MKFNHLKVPKKLLIIIFVLLVLGFAAAPIIDALTTEKQLAESIILSIIPFILIFAAIILFYISIIGMVSSVLNNRIQASVFKAIENLLIAGIGLGIAGMFQPWIFPLYTYGFLLLLFSTLGFILWSHVIPADEHEPEDVDIAAGVHN